MICVCPNYNPMCPYSREAQGVLRQKKKKGCDQGGRDWSDVTNPRVCGPPEAGRGNDEFSPRVFGENTALPTT